MPQERMVAARAADTRTAAHVRSTEAEAPSARSDERMVFVTRGAFRQVTCWELMRATETKGAIETPRTRESLT